MEPSARQSCNDSGHLPSAHAICYPVKVTRAVLTSSSEVPAADGFPISTTITALNEPVGVAAAEHQSEVPQILPVSVLGQLPERPHASAIFYPLRTATDTLGEDDSRASPGPNRSMNVALAPTAAASSKSASQRTLKSRSFVSEISNGIVFLAAAFLLIWRAPSPHVADLQPISGPSLLADGTPNQKSADMAEDPERLSKLTESTSIPTQTIPIEPVVSVTQSGSDLAEILAVDVAPTADTIVSTTPFPDSPHQSLGAAESGPDVASRDERTHGRTNPEDALSILSEGQRRIQGGDVLGAREAFRRAADMGLAQAALALGSTYDPRSLAELGIRDVIPDAAIAVTWYRRAHIMAGRATTVARR